MLTKQNLDQIESIEGMTTREGLVLMHLAINKMSPIKGIGTSFEFGAYKGRTAALMLASMREGFLHVVESADYLQEERLNEIGRNYKWHKETSENFCTNLTKHISTEAPLAVTHHDASHFFDNVYHEIKGVLSCATEYSVLILDDFNDSYSQVRAAYYYLRYAENMPFELVLIGFNKAILVHQDRFEEIENYILSDFLDDLEKMGIVAKLVRTDNNERSRAFHVRTRRSTEERHYGTQFFGNRFYRTSA